MRSDVHVRNNLDSHVLCTHLRNACTRTKTRMHVHDACTLGFVMLAVFRRLIYSSHHFSPDALSVIIYARGSLHLFLLLLPYNDAVCMQWNLWVTLFHKLRWSQV